MKMMCVAMPSSSLRMWEVMNTSLFFSLTILSFRMLAAMGSRLAVGSSRMRMSGLKRNARAAFTFWLVPPDRVFVFLPAMASISKAS